MRWWSSDAHFSHANIINFCDRPYSDVNQMNTDLVNRINARVQPEDELWLLGDIAMGDISSSLPGNLGRIICPIHLVAGNHDRCHPSYGSKHERYTDFYKNAPNVTQLTITNTTTVLANGIEVNVSHFPYASVDARPSIRRDGTQEMADKFLQWRPVDDGKWLLCGHVHEKWRQRGRIINVGIDAWGGVPINENQIIELINQGPAERDILPWFPN